MARKKRRKKKRTSALQHQAQEEEVEVRSTLSAATIHYLSHFLPFTTPFLRTALPSFLYFYSLHFSPLSYFYVFHNFRSSCCYVPFKEEEVEEQQQWVVSSIQISLAQVRKVQKLELGSLFDDAGV